MVFQLFLNIWDMRNKAGHNLNDRQESQLSRQRILDKIIALQDSAPEVRYCDRDFVFYDMDTLQAYSLGNLTAWYNSACKIVRAQKQYNICHPSIRDIFPLRSPIFPAPRTSLLPPPEPYPDSTRNSPPSEPDPGPIRTTE